MLLNSQSKARPDDYSFKPQCSGFSESAESVGAEMIAQFSNGWERQADSLVAGSRGMKSMTKRRARFSNRAVKASTCGWLACRFKINTMAPSVRKRTVCSESNHSLTKMGRIVVWAEIMMISAKPAYLEAA